MKNDNTYQRFADMIDGLKKPDWASIDWYYARCQEQSIFDDQNVEEMVVRYKKAEIRKMLRQRSNDPGRTPEEYFNLAAQTEEGKAVQVYKQLSLFDVGDFVQVIGDRMRRAKKWQDEVDRLTNLAIAKFGQQIRDMLPSPREELATA